MLEYSPYIGTSAHYPFRGWFLVFLTSWDMIELRVCELCYRWASLNSLQKLLWKIHQRALVLFNISPRARQSGIFFKFPCELSSLKSHSSTMNPNPEQQSAPRDAGPKDLGTCTSTQHEFLHNLMYNARRKVP